MSPPAENGAEGPGRAGPDWLTLAAFVGVVLIGGSNFVAVRFSNRELPPFLGAGIRFGLAAVLLLALVRIQGLELPRGRALLGAAIFGLVTFTGAYALTYYGLVQAQAGLGAVFAAFAPLLTIFLTAAQRVEPFRWRGLLGALFAIVGVLIMTRAPSVAGVPLGSLLALFGLAVCISESGIIVKQFPRMHPVALNAVAMAIGTPPLLVLSLVTGEQWRVPTSLSTWLTLAYVVPVGSVLLFVLVVYVLNRWTATALSYATVLFPVVSFGLGALLASEALSPALAAGAAVTIIGVYLGALRRADAPAKS
ncbi:MAG: EamA family transporter [Candidatus Dormiibacterota bacterium]